MSEVKVGKNESLDSALRRFKKQCARTGILSELRRREHYEKPSVRRKKKAEAARKKKRALQIALGGVSMELLEKLLEDQKLAMKAREKLRLNVIRGLRSEIKNAEIARKQPLTEEEALSILQRELKKRKEALADYEKAGRPSLLQELKEEMEIISAYLPPQLSEEEIKEMAQEAIAGLGASSKKEMGKVMGVLMPRVKGKADGAIVRKIVEDLLK